MPRWWIRLPDAGVLEKLGVTSNAELIRYCIHHSIAAAE
jgi:hypothetical protein